MSKIGAGSGEVDVEEDPDVERVTKEEDKVLLEVGTNVASVPFPSKRKLASSSTVVVAFEVGTTVVAAGGVVVDVDAVLTLGETEVLEEDDVPVAAGHSPNR